MRIAVLSDTHDLLPESVCARIASADEIWHLGDVCEPAILDRLRAVGPPVQIVRGNCDSTLDWPLTLDLDRAGFRARLVHIPARTAPPGCDLFLHGHTHVPRDEMIAGARFLNPGCITRPNCGAPASYAWLDLDPGRPAGWKIVRL